MNTRTSLIALPGQGWVSDLHPATVQLLHDAKFSLVPCPTSARFGRAAVPEVGVCVSSEISPTVSDALQFFSRVRELYQPSRVLSLTIVGPQETPLAGIGFDGRFEPALIEGNSTQWFPKEYVVRDYVSVVWSLGAQRRETFWLQRNVWASSTKGQFLSNPHQPEGTLSLDDLLGLSLGTRFSRTDVSTVPLLHRVHAQDVGMFLWNNAQITTLRDNIVIKELILRQLCPTGSTRNPWLERGVIEMH